jgi:hypothetical protein
MSNTQSIASIYLTADIRRDLLLEWWGAKRIIRLCHVRGMYERAARVRARMHEIESLFAKVEGQS